MTPVIAGVPAGTYVPLTTKGDNTMLFARKPAYGKYMLAFALGAVAGAAVALLYAPMTGKRMQKRVGDVTEKVLDATDKVLDKVEEQVGNVQGFVKKMAKA